MMSFLIIFGALPCYKAIHIMPHPYTVCTAIQLWLAQAWCGTSIGTAGTTHQYLHARRKQLYHCLNFSHTGSSLV